MTNDLAKALFSRTFEDRDAQDSLRVIYDLCGSNEISVCRTADGSVDTGATLFNEGRRSVWLDIRKLLPSYVLEYVEVTLAFNEDTDDTILN